MASATPSSSSRAGGAVRPADDDSASYHSDSSFDSHDDQDWADWVEDQPPALALFPDQDGSYPTLPSALAAIQDGAQKGCDVRNVVRTLDLDTLGAIRLVNRIRRLKLAPSDVNALTGNEDWWQGEQELKPVDGGDEDPLLQFDFDGEQFGDDGHGHLDRASTAAAPTAAAAGGAASEQIEQLQHELEATRATLREVQSRLLATMGVSSSSLDSDRRGPVAGLKPTAKLAKLTPGGKEGRDDDSHYFDSYASNDIHQTMISDRARTLSYARFLLSPANSHLIRGKTVMDVGCGSGILSLFCARAGAKRVVAIDASNVAKRARANVEENGFGHVVTVVQGKVEDLDDELAQYAAGVDLLVSEWMGYFLLYECMLPSVLYARDRYLAPTGILAPSHCRMTLAAVSDQELLHERIHFWNDVHGFRMSEMQKGLYDEAYTEELKNDAVVSDVCDIYDLPLQVLSYRQPTFTSPFTLTIKEEETTIHALASWFDTWFTPDSKPWPRSAQTGEEEKRDTVGGERLQGLGACTVEAPTESDVYGLDLQGSAVTAPPPPPPEQEGAKGEVVSFTTGPHGLMTHWKQTVFLLKQPIQASRGDTITGSIQVIQSADNSRELEVELHYEVRPASLGPVRTKGEGVGTRLVQLYKVR
ncbi:uncharacterized protein PFL1_05635 [Pseudozyma flocculosa PF-1]|uniref:type I protein arginine methyltransferase n=2 Tax=Pseudozyma flocculosa TaxID=84751 RepID=A0A5C3FD39_9BASI|nr:uncharacterized protein PFL1_05635 [Pseudozyma flocculosa PF-1]EPQ26655.1 hypothetical protein PFL1_05635 [Pseudozyma flocculosa PF-1]SPO42180.1 related to hnRNP arginine N-methyltransferase [Pseudozyma flocculosa]